MEEMIKKYTKITVFCLIMIICFALGTRNKMNSMMPEKETISETDIVAQIEKAKKEIEREKKEQIANEQETASFEQVQQEEVQQTEEQDIINQQNDEMVEQNYIN